MTPQQLQDLMRQLGYSDPGFEPPPLPGTNDTLNLPHQAMDVSPGVFNPMNIPPNEQMFPDGGGYYPPDYPPDFNNQNFPDTVYNPPTNEASVATGQDNYFPPDLTNPPPNENMLASGNNDYFPADVPPDFSNITPDYTQPQDFTNGAFPVGGQFPWPYDINEFPGGDRVAVRHGIAGNDPTERPSRSSECSLPNANHWSKQHSGRESFLLRFTHIDPE